MTDESGDTNIQERYAARFAADLENNTKEREAIRSSIAELRARLERLETEAAWLSTMRGAVTTAPGTGRGERPAEAGPTAGAPATLQADTRADTQADVTADDASAESPAEGDAPAPDAAPQAVPRPRRAKKAAAGQRARKAKAARAKSAPAPEAKAAEKPAANGRRTGPTRRDLVLGLLAQHHEPRTAGEVTKELEEAHPERAASTQVVRNALESLVSTGDVERERQQKSVFYTVPGTAVAAPEAVAGATGEDVAAGV
ncbi:hypothetical protein EKH77_32115 [Streptomyces luteoverticillatus]|uniref:Uncharacterized protein n=1 Tax=Streptomyces luteoverticillatus TaxID=66425 RepID=A0A3S9PS30_STRLT|nr:hypothetical protein [Streptomyces luteoverticillatus]AZQ75177.1 hypothetical protein EKH77_32115 [Streptomyces luteoverticillatus]